MIILNIVEIDVDGVLLDVYTPVEEHLRQQGLRFSFEKSVKTWSMKETGNLRPVLLKLLTDADTRKYATWYPGAVEFISVLADKCREQGYKLVLNTHEFNMPCANVKVEKLKELRALTGARFETNIQCSYNKEMLDSLICVDDSLENICRSPSKNPLLFNSFHNTELYNGPRKGFKRVYTYYEIMQELNKVKVG